MCAQLDLYAKMAFWWPWWRSRLDEAKASCCATQKNAAALKWKQPNQLIIRCSFLIVVVNFVFAQSLFEKKIRDKKRQQVEKVNTQFEINLPANIAFHWALAIGNDEWVCYQQTLPRSECSEKCKRRWNLREKNQTLKHNIQRKLICFIHATDSTIAF